MSLENDRTAEIIYTCIEENGPITVTEIREKTNYIHHVIEVTIRLLREAGLVVQSGMTIIGNGSEPDFIVSSLSSRQKAKENHT